jgi:hypothetical protein
MLIKLYRVGNNLEVLEDEFEIYKKRIKIPFSSKISTVSWDFEIYFDKNGKPLGDWSKSDFGFTREEAIEKYKSSIKNALEMAENSLNFWRKKLAEVENLR